MTTIATSLCPRKIAQVKSIWSQRTLTRIPVTSWPGMACDQTEANRVDEIGGDYAPGRGGWRDGDGLLCERASAASDQAEGGELKAQAVLPHRAGALRTHGARRVPRLSSKSGVLNPAGVLPPDSVQPSDIRILSQRSGA